MQLFRSAIFFLVLSAASMASAAERVPNVILILVDDMGWRDWSGAGNTICRTPNIDQLSREGMYFTQAYAACAVCSPTRAAVQTGRYPARLGVTDWIRSRFQRPGGVTPDRNPTEYVGGPKVKLLCPPNPFWMESQEVTLAEMLKLRSYHTAYIGKWHLGDDAWYPEHQGFDVNLGGCDYGQPPNYFDPFNQPNGKHSTLREGIYQLPGRENGEYLTDRESSEACRLIRQWKDEPFFIQLSHYAVHTPLQAPAHDIAKYSREGVTKQQATYAAMVESVDRSLAQIRQTLAELNLTEETIVWFTSDNGGLDNGANPTENLPLRAGKGYPYEGGIRVPNLVAWPGKIPGGETATPFCSIDILPTVAEFVGAEVEQEIDGVSFAGHLTSGGQTSIAARPLIWHFPHYRGDVTPYSIIRRGNWKLIHFYEGVDELFDLASDPGELNNVAEANQDLVAELAAELQEELDAMGAKLPRRNDQLP